MEPDEWIDAYLNLAEDAMEPVAETVYMLGAMAAAAAAWGELRDVPEDWEWPSATKDFNGE